MFSEAWLADYKAKMDARRIALVPDAEPADKPKRAKFGNSKTAQGGEQFDSKKEAARWLQLQALEQAGKISQLQRQVKFELVPSAKIKGRKKPPIRYFADFTYYENGVLVVEDVKGKLTPVYIMKRHMMRAFHNIEIKET